MNMFSNYLYLIKAIYVALLALVLFGCARDQSIHFEGEAQGTTYHVTVAACAIAQTAEQLQESIETRLQLLDQSLSNYREDSVLSSLNRAPIDTWVELDHDLYAVLKISEKMSRESNGAFDVTVAPLVSLWGFGPDHRSQTTPSDAAIAEARTRIGYQYLDIDSTQPRARKRRDIVIDINGIAQGYSVDRLADVLLKQRCTDFMVELGGELRVAGRKANGEPWRIGIEQPVAASESVSQALALDNVGVTTAGDYRNYFEKDGQRYSHTIDPRSGRPITHKLAAVTVVADSATLADGYDTVLEVLGPDEGLAYARAHNLAAYFIVHNGKSFQVFYTQKMRRYFDPPVQ